MLTLKEEWIERIKIVKQRNVFPSGGGMFTVMTDFYEAPEEIRNDVEMCKKVLLESNECIWNIPKKIRTIAFLEEIIKKGYKGNILESKHEWPEEDFLFVKKYLSNFSKDKKPSFNSSILNKGILENKDMVLSLVIEDNYHDMKNLLNKFSKDKEIMFALLDNHPNEISSMTKSMKNAYFKDSENIFKILKSSISNYFHLPKKFQLIDKVIDYSLTMDCSILCRLPQEVVENREKVLNLIKKFPKISGSHIPNIQSNDYEIAKLMIERDGANFSYFKFKKNDELIKLASNTYNSIDYMPATKEYEELIIKVVLRSNQEENNKNLSYINGNGLKAQMVKNLFPQLLIEKKVYSKTIAKFFENYELVNSKELDRISNFNSNKELLIKCIEISPLIYEQIDIFTRESIDFKVLNTYVNSSKDKGLDYNLKIPQKIKNLAQSENLDLDKYILNEYLKEKLKPLIKVKAKKI